jgi:hypothetical protein
VGLVTGEVPERFAARQAVERLRSGLFDPTAVRELTAGEERLRAAVEPALSGESPHLCVSGAYGQGKSHSLRWISELALQRGFAVSLITVDPREIPLHDARAVYRASMASLRLPGAEGPGSDALISRWVAFAREQPGPPEELLPEGMPRLFRLVLGALARQTRPLTAEQRRQRQHRGYYSARFAPDLVRALQGHPLPMPRIRAALRYREVPDAKGGVLAWSGPEPLLAALRGLTWLLRALGLSGLAILFDEGESIVQTRPGSRQKSWKFLRELLLPEPPVPGLVPVFAFTEELLWKMEEETSLTRGSLSLLRLVDLSPAEWQMLAERLVTLHGRAYGWRPGEEIPSLLQRRLLSMRGQETRPKLKALVDELDLLDQAGS